MFVSPPRTIADIAAILDQEKPDPARLRRDQQLADQAAPAKASHADLVTFYRDRGRARSELGRLREAIADTDKAIEHAQGRGDREVLGVREFRATLLLNASEFTSALAELQTLSRMALQIQAKGFLFNAYRQIVQAYVAFGDFGQADAYMRRLRALFEEARSFQIFSLYRYRWESDVERAAGTISEARGNFREALAAYGRSERLLREALNRLHLTPEVSRPPLENRVDLEIALQARNKARLGRLAEAEADVRRSLLSRLRARGKYAITTATHVSQLSLVLREQGRYAEAEKLQRIAIEISTTLGTGPDSQASAEYLRSLSYLLRLQERYDEAANTDRELDKRIASWGNARRSAFELSSERVYSLYVSGQTEQGINAAKALLARDIARLGDSDASVAVARGLLAIGLAKAGRDAEATAEFQKSIPQLLSSAGERDMEDSSTAALRDLRARDVIEAYLLLLERTKSGPELVAETFRLSDALRSRSVQGALAASSTRMAVRDPALAELARKLQDVELQIGAQLGVLNNALALPPEQRSEDAIKKTRAEIDRLRAARSAAQRDVQRRFPDYAQLVNPTSPTIDEVRAVLKPGEVLVSFHVGRETSFGWAIPKEGSPVFARIAATAREIDAKVQRVRAGIQLNDTVPDFDVATAFELYERLLQPLEAGWQTSKELIVVTNGSLGLLPLSMLPTRNVTLPSPSTVMLTEYRDVPWLARSHAVSYIPGAAALVSLRKLPPGSQSREPLMGFGDPYFTPQQAAEADSASAQAVQMTGRSGRPRVRARVDTRDVDSAEFDRLPRLADTAEELRAVAAVLSTDERKALRLGRDANERVVKQMDLSRYQVLAFSTHGLVPGDLDGLTQPALALTAPAVAGVDGDGLLTMDEILALRLNADWVVLSACNTASGIGADAEAISGLGRAFFYAGTRALLVTNWSVHSPSARDLVTDIFRRQADNPNLARGEALRLSMLALMDTGGYAEDGKVLHTYAHPAFWAPYSVVGNSAVK